MQLQMDYKGNGIDFTVGCFQAVLPMNDQLYPVSFVTEFMPNEGALFPTGRVVVTMVHPDHGTIVFHLRHQEDRWIIDTSDHYSAISADMQLLPLSSFDLPDSIVEWCGDMLHNHLT